MLSIGVALNPVRSIVSYQSWYSVFLSQQNSINRLISHRNDQANRVIDIDISHVNITSVCVVPCNLQKKYYGISREGGFVRCNLKISNFFLLFYLLFFGTLEFLMSYMFHCCDNCNVFVIIVVWRIFIRRCLNPKTLHCLNKVSCGKIGPS